MDSSLRSVFSPRGGEPFGSHTGALRRHLPADASHGSPSSGVWQVVQLQFSVGVPDEQPSNPLAAARATRVLRRSEASNHVETLSSVAQPLAQPG